MTLSARLLVTGALCLLCRPAPALQYSWTSGPWGLCWSESGCGRGVEQRTVWCADTLGRTVPAALCRGAHRPPDSRLCYTTCQGGAWQSGPWSECLMNSPPDELEGGLCGGTRSRNVTCLTRASDGAAPLPCAGPQPPSEAPCAVACPQPCVVGPWSAWTRCHTCGQLQSRNRAVIEAPSHHGQQCPKLTEVRTCHKDCQPLTTTHKPPKPWLEVGQWGDCKPLQTSRTKSSFAKHRKDLYNLERMSPSSADDEDAGRGSSGDGAPGVVREVQGPSATPPPAAATTADVASSGSGLAGASGAQERVGTQTRRLTCRAQGGNTLPLSACLHEEGVLPPRARPCALPAACVVTEWSAWATLTRGCVGPAGQVVREVRERKRYALALQRGAGQPCPHLVESHSLARPRLVPCDVRYEWMPTSWGPCVSPLGPDTASPVTCGGGVQQRRVFCARAVDGAPVPAALCAHLQPPPVYQRCEVGCERDCSLGPWSAWGTCTAADCSLTPPPAAPGFRRRRREVLVSPSAGGRECGALEEQSECHGAQCHQWVVSDWHGCVLDAPHLRCGPGHMTRNTTCLDAYGRPSPKEECEDELGSVSELKPCHLPCPYDCVLAAWSPWSACSRACSDERQVGYTRRNTTILAQPGPGGHACPDPDALTEVSTCRLEPCGGAAWRPGPWSSCIPHGEAKCGPGGQTRELRCVGPHGLSLSLERCRGLQQPVQERPCEVACGTPCSVSPWSDWSYCTGPQACTAGAVSSVQRRHREVLVAPSGAGEPCPRLVQERACAVAPQACLRPHWSPEPWSGCHLNADDTCGSGIRVRDVTCRDEVGRVLEPTSCLLQNIVVPASSEECHVNCSSGCVTSDWSDWSPCPSAAHACSDTFSSRRRNLIDQSERDEGCVDIPLQERRPCPCLAHHSAAASPWSQCIIGGPQQRRARRAGARAALRKWSQRQTSDDARHAVSGRGDRASTVRGEAHRSHPQTLNEIYDSSDTLPVSVGENINFMGDLDEFKNYISMYKEKLPASDSLSEEIWLTDEEQERELQEEMMNEIIRVDVDTEDDLDARGSSSEQPEEQQLCGVGARYRALHCYNSHNVIVHPSSCDHDGWEWEPCMVECSVDCRVGAWGPWSACNSSCGPGLQIRTRPVLTEDMWGGRRCPEVQQSRVCWGSCEGSWRTGGWGECETSGGAGLTHEGEGTQTRHVSCTKTTEDGLEEEASEQECAGLARPPHTQPCRVAPPGECVVGPWSAWSLCSPGCVMHSSRNRTRVVLRRPLEAAGGSAAPTCPPLQETEPCLAGVSCWWYTWQVGNWTSCVPLGQSACGEGVMNRPVACVRSDGVKVHERWCGEESKPTPRETWCYVDCPIDCQVSPWSAWQDSLCVCGNSPGNMTRDRHITVNPSESGRVCPADLLQQKPCPALPCYTWRRGPWGRCALQGAACGHGTVRRSVDCVGPAGERVSPALCLDLVHVGGHTWPFLSHALDLNTEDSCFVSCEGGCEMTEWSAWSHCHRDCTNGEASGVQTRTRGVLSSGQGAPCPHPLQQTRPCLTGPCRSYEWQFRDGEPLCVRDDGVTVTRGCNETHRPCYPGCALANSRCSVLGWCVCRAGYRATYSGQQQQQYALTSCLPLAPADAASSRAALPLTQRLTSHAAAPYEVNAWVFAMLGVASAFVCFLAVALYLLCRQTQRQHPGLSPAAAAPTGEEQSSPAGPDKLPRPRVLHNPLYDRPQLELQAARGRLSPLLQSGCPAEGVSEAVRELHT